MPFPDASRATFMTVTIGVQQAEFTARNVGFAGRLLPDRSRQQEGGKLPSPSIQPQPFRVAVGHPAASLVENLKLYLGRPQFQKGAPILRRGRSEAKTLAFAIPEQQPFRLEASRDVLRLAAK